MHLTALHGGSQGSLEPLLLLDVVTSRDAVKVPLPSQLFLRWDVELEEGISFGTIVICICSMQLQRAPEQL